MDALGCCDIGCCCALKCSNTGTSIYRTCNALSTSACTEPRSHRPAAAQAAEGLPSSDPRSPAHPLAPYLAAGSAMLAKTANSAHALPTKRQLAAKQTAKAEAAQRTASQAAGEPHAVLSIAGSTGSSSCLDVRLIFVQT